MTTTLQQQLSLIASKSTHQLDLRAQKSRHSQSLLFSPHDAAAQSFDTIYQICYEGFEELCALDGRFERFAGNLFAEQSRYEDRSQMTAGENGELDRVIEAFLGLVSGRLLLRPGMKAVEWCVRRFRAHEYNTEALLLTFLPYHSAAQIFPTLLSILPEQLPSTFKWLHPYVAALQCPPRSAVVAAIGANQALFAAFNTHVLAVAKARHHSAALLGFWASVLAQAVNFIVDSSRSGRADVRRQREEDLLLRILPVAQEALGTGVQECYLGACMVLTILATKASLADRVLDAMKEAVAGAWTEETQMEGLTCLAIIAEEKEDVALPRRVVRALEQPHAMPRLMHLGKTQRAGKLVAGLALAVLVRAFKEKDLPSLSMVGDLLNVEVMDERCTLLVLEGLVTRLAEMREKDPTSDACSTLSELLVNFAQDPARADLLQDALRAAHLDARTLQLPPPTISTEDDEPEPMHIDEAEDPVQVSNEEQHARFDAQLGSLPHLPTEATSFMDSAQDAAFEAYIRVFQASLTSTSSTERFLGLPQLHRADSIKRPESLTFVARIWTADASSNPAKVAALSAARTQLASSATAKRLDTQTLIPYLLIALSDPTSSKVRRQAAQLCKAMHASYGDKAGKDCTPSPVGRIYGANSGKLGQLSSEDAYRLLSGAIVPILEDCVVEGAYAMRALTDLLNHGALGAEKEGSGKGTLKKSLRANASLFLAGHAVATPVANVKLALLRLLSRVGKSAMQARSAVLVPYVKEWAAASKQDEGSEMDRAVIESLTHRSHEEVLLLKDLTTSARPELQALAFGRLQHVFSATKTPQTQVELVDFSLERALMGTDLALESLRSLQLTTDVLVHLLENVPSASVLQDGPRSPKRQRTSKNTSTSSPPVDSQKLQAAIRHITLVLELLESSHPERHPQLLKPLFHLLAELRQYKALTGSELVYVQQLILDNLLSCVSTASTSMNIDRSVIRTDLIVDCVRTTTSTRLHNSALLLVSALAAWQPEMVLHSVMPLFTFMGTTTLRQSDDFSAHVTDLAVTRIVPALAESLKRSKGGVLVGAEELLLSFVGAFEHVPLHRRLGLFRLLVATLGEEESLGAVVGMLVERYLDVDGVRVGSFVVELVGEFGAEMGLRAVVRVLEFVFEGLNRGSSKVADVLLGFAVKEGSEVEHSVDVLLEGLVKLLKDDGFRAKLKMELQREDEDDTAERLRAIYATLLEKTMQLGRLVPAAHTDSANALLSPVLGLLPTKDFISSSAQLMQTGSDETRQQVFASLEARVAESGQRDARTFVDVLPNCAIFVRVDQPMRTRHAAVSCIDLIAEKFGKVDRGAVLAAARVVAGEAGLGSREGEMRVICCLCLASMVGVLGDEALEVLPGVVGTTLGYLEESVDAASDFVELQDAGFSLLADIGDHLPWMLSGGLLHRALRIADRTANATGDGGGHLKRFCKLVATRVGALELFSALERTWPEESTTAEHYNHLEMLETGIRYHTKAVVTRNAPTLFAILLKAFGLRLLYSRDEAPDAETAERFASENEQLFEFVNTIALDLVLKLNDATFRPFFMRLVDQVQNTSPGDTLRAISLFSFAATFFEQLKSLVTSYAGLLLEAAAVRLNQDLPAEWKGYVLQTLSASFRHDQDDFWQSPAHFEAINLPLLRQLKAPGFKEQKEVIPTITDLAAATSPEHHKSMNATIMSYMRHEHADVRLAAVQCERSVTERLGLEWLTLLPEMLPFISELQENDDERVEREVLRWVGQIEAVTGESLEGMLA
ncbi:snoRNA-binding rRNA-processing protein utp10 [Vermiconidia calcicola]|uniref:SnoRNA-binding rRNA-processing protein utp10 n=1 Tax=Vermiconidia calcicola TaxID=1690605 RepID=A0ACC3MSY7_9PEZI|nr:snoRNA-binding rRNA-processing protein utp10 [Vermiconidia calcicola]